MPIESREKCEECENVLVSALGKLEGVCSACIAERAEGGESA